MLLSTFVGTERPVQVAQGCPENTQARHCTSHTASHVPSQLYDRGRPPDDSLEVYFPNDCACVLSAVDHRSHTGYFALRLSFRTQLLTIPDDEVSTSCLPWDETYVSNQDKPMLCLSEMIVFL